MTQHNAHNYVPGGIKSVQRGYAAESTLGTPITLDPVVDPDKSIALLTSTSGSTNQYVVSLTATQLTLAPVGTSTIISWTVIEFY